MKSSWKMYFLILANRKNTQAVHEYKEDDKTTHLKKVIPIPTLLKARKP